jgi:hypothetical protein
MFEKAEEVAEAAETKTKARLERRSGYDLMYLILRNKLKSFWLGTVPAYISVSVAARETLKKCTVAPLKRQRVISASVEGIMRHIALLDGKHQKRRFLNPSPRQNRAIIHSPNPTGHTQLLLAVALSLLYPPLIPLCLQLVAASAHHHVN